MIRALLLLNRRHHRERLRLSSRISAPRNICRQSTTNPGFSPRPEIGGPSGVSYSSLRLESRLFSQSTPNDWSPKLSVSSKLPFPLTVIFRHWAGLQAGVRPTNEGPNLKASGERSSQENGKYLRNWWKDQYQISCLVQLYELGKSLAPQMLSSFCSNLYCKFRLRRPWKSVWSLKGLGCHRASQKFFDQGSEWISSFTSEWSQITSDD